MISHDKSIQLLTVTLVAVRRKVTLVAGTTCKFQALSAVTGKGKRDIPWYIYKLLNNNIPWFFSTYRWKLLEDVSEEFASASAVLKAGKRWTLGQGGALEVVKTMGKLWKTMGKIEQTLETWWFMRLLSKSQINGLKWCIRKDRISDLCGMCRLWSLRSRSCRMSTGRTGCWQRTMEPPKVWSFKDHSGYYWVDVVCLGQPCVPLGWGNFWVPGVRNNVRPVIDITEWIMC